MFLKNKNIIFKIRRSKVTDYAALKTKYVPLADIYEIKNTPTHKFAFCDCTLIVAMVTLQEA